MVLDIQRVDRHYCVFGFTVRHFCLSEMQLGVGLLFALAVAFS